MVSDATEEGQKCLGDCMQLIYRFKTDPIGNEASVIQAP